MANRTRAELAELRHSVEKHGFHKIVGLSGLLGDLLSAAESRLAMLDALSAERAEEIAEIMGSYGVNWAPETRAKLRAYALAIRKGAGE